MSPRPNVSPFSTHRADIPVTRPERLAPLDLDAWADYERANRRANWAYRREQLDREGLCAACGIRKRDTNNRSRRCWQCRHDGNEEIK